MFRKILIPLDGSELSAKALAFLDPVLQLGAAELVLLGVREEGRDPTPHLEARRTELGQRARTSILVRDGDPAAQILEAADELGASLIVMSTHGRTGLSRLVRGSVAERVLRGAQVPILLVNPFTAQRAPEAPIRTILVPLDGSERSASIVTLVAQLAPVYGARVRLLRAGLLGSAERRRWEEQQAAHERELREALTPCVEQLAAAGIDATVEVAFTHGAPDAILQAAGTSDVDLVALTTHGRSGPSRWLYGSVAEHVIRECRCPLLVMRTAQ